MSGSTVDAELIALFRQEVRLREKTLRAAHTDSNSALRSLHSLKGSASMMGAKSLAHQIASLELWVKTVGVSQPDALWSHLLLLLEEERISVPPTPAHLSQQTAFDGTNTTAGAPTAVPLDRARYNTGAVRSAIDVEIRQFFGSESRARMEQFARALERSQHETAWLDALKESFTHIHALKGGALTLGFTVLAQDAHAIESALAALIDQQQPLAGPVYQAVSRAAELLTVELGLLEESERISQQIVQVMRQLREPRTSRASGSATAGEVKSDARSSEAIRISNADLAGLEERLADLLALTEEWSASQVAHATLPQQLRTLTARVEEAARKLGPPRPWGVTQETLDRFGSIAKELREYTLMLEQDALETSRASARLVTLAVSSAESMQRLGVTDFQWICGRLSAAIESAARVEDKTVRVERVGVGVTLPRRIAERLVEPLTQIARNAVTHGIEPPAERAAKDKPARGVVRLSATSANALLTISIEDDGAGVDFDLVRAQAAARKLGHSAHTRESLAELLFSPGFSTRTSADSLAGRGVGLDLVKRELRSLGGSVSVDSVRGSWTRFSIQIPIRSALISVLVVCDGQDRVAIPIECVRTVRERHADEQVVSLASWLGERVESTGSLAEKHIVLELYDRPAVTALAVDVVEQAREVLVRPMPPLLTDFDRWLGAIVDTDNSVILVLNPRSS